MYPRLDALALFCIILQRLADVNPPNMESAATPIARVHIEAVLLSKHWLMCLYRSLSLRRTMFEESFEARVLERILHGRIQPWHKIPKVFP